jgi:hypothetical protein
MSLSCRLPLRIDDRYPITKRDDAWRTARGILTQALFGYANCWCNCVDSYRYCRSIFSIFYLGLLVARFTGEDLLGRTRKNNFFDRLFLHTVFMAFLVYAIAIPFFLIEPTSLPLSVGILTGLMWVPFSGIIQHWVGIFHSVARTVLIVAAWYLFPERRFVVIPAVIVSIYPITIYILANRVSSPIDPDRTRNFSSPD